MTFSIVARAGDAFGVAVASKFLAAAALVPWCRASAGAIATQAFANLSYGPQGLDLLAASGTSAAVITSLTSGDNLSAQRQVGVVDSFGNASTFTGSECMDWAGGRTGEGYAAQGNILTGPEVVDALCSTFERSTGPLADRLVEALCAADTAGGDRRGRQAAGVIVVSPAGGYGGTTDVVVDLRIDDHPDPCTELQRLLGLHHLYFDRPTANDLLDLDETLISELRTRLSALGYAIGDGSTYDAITRKSLEQFAGWENLEERLVEQAQLDRHILSALRTRGTD